MTEQSVPLSRVKQSRNEFVTSRSYSVNHVVMTVSHQPWVEK